MASKKRKSDIIEAQRREDELLAARGDMPENDAVQQPSAPTDEPSAPSLPEASTADEAPSEAEGAQDDKRDDGGIIRIGEQAASRKVNKFDAFWIKVWAGMCAFVSAIASGINKVIKLIFKKAPPQKYVTATVATLLIIIAVAIVSAPFKITINKKETLDIFSDKLVAVQSNVGRDENGTPIYKWGFADHKGDIKIECKYDDVMDFKYGVAFVYQESKIVDGGLKQEWYLINKRGKRVGALAFINTDDPNFSTVNQFSDSNKLARIYKSGYGYIGTDGKIKIECMYQDAGDFIDGLARVRLGDEQFYIDSKGKQKSERYDQVRDFSDGLGAVKKNGNWGFVGTDGKNKTEYRYSAVSDFYLGYAIVKNNGSYGVIDSSGKSIVPIGQFTDLKIIDKFETIYE